MSYVNCNLDSTSFNLQSVFSAESVHLLQKLKKVNSEYFFRPDQSLINTIKIMNPVDLKKILNCLFIEMIRDGSIHDPVKLLERFAQIIPLSKLQEVLKKDIKGILKEAQDRFKEAELYLQTNQTTASPTVITRLLTLLDTIVRTIENIILAFGIGDFFKPAESDLQGDFKSNKIMMLLTLFSLMTTMILPISGAAVAGLIVGGTLLGIAVLSVLWPHIKPITSHLPANAENWTKQARENGLTVHGRKETLDEIANILKMNRHAILIGPSRVGKSLTAKAFAQAVERGEYPELQGKIIFRINTSDIVGHKASFMGGGNPILNNISGAMGRHRDNIVLILDEIHMACKNNEKIADQLKTFLDEGGEFPHVIGITTEEEYNKYVKENTAFSLRFNRVDIQSTGREETVGILCNIALGNSTKPIFENGVLEYIYERSATNRDAPQPASAIKLFKRCINHTQPAQRSLLEKKISAISRQIFSLHMQSALTRHGSSTTEKVKIELLEKELAEHRESLKHEHESLDMLFKTKELFDRAVKVGFEHVIKISKMALNALKKKDERQVALHLLLHEFLVPALEDYVKTKAEQIGVSLVIDKALVDRLELT